MNNKRFRISGDRVVHMQLRRSDELEKRWCRVLKVNNRASESIYTTLEVGAKRLQLVVMWSLLLDPVKRLAAQVCSREPTGRSLVEAEETVAVDQVWGNDSM